MAFDILEHLFLGHGVGVSVGIKALDKIVRSVAHFTLLAVQKRVGKAGNVSRSFPYPWVHQNVGVKLEAVAALLNKALSPSVLNIVLKSGA